ncbi:hypothetical protein QYE76_004267 [Lolium multiflorum]|uniref:Uncharacterized protein n=1 Tax=Lolium multiflorum TaxID=4521 RepID=A0AAD8RSW0_LOLMU|nr:hypothetical protein QYE76_004267 [Lolium multiflorum]
MVQDGIQGVEPAWALVQELADFWDWSSAKPDSLILDTWIRVHEKCMVLLNPSVRRKTQGWLVEPIKRRDSVPSVGGNVGAAWGRRWKPAQLEADKWVEIRSSSIPILMGNRVKTEVSRYDSSKGHIIYRLPHKDSKRIEDLKDIEDSKDSEDLKDTTDSKD